jgi:hypothetical protein
MELMKLKYKNEILLFFIVVFGSTILYYGLGKICKKGTVIEGVRTNNTMDNSESIEIKQMKQKLKIMENEVTNKVQPKVNNLLEKIKGVKTQISGGMKEESDKKINEFSDNNKKVKQFSKQDKVPPFSSSEISSAFK